MRHFCVAIVVFAWACARAAEAGTLRGQAGPSSADDVLAQLGHALTGSSSTAEVEERVVNMVEALRPIFLALPRSTEGYLEAAAVRYLLHRHFNDRDGWFMQGWDAAGEDADNFLPEVVLRGEPLAGEFSKRLADRGLSVREVAVLATAVETLATRETTQRLHLAYRFAGVSHHENHTAEADLDLVFRAYWTIYTMGFNHESTTTMELSDMLAHIHEAYPRWDELLLWFHEVRKEVLALNPGKRASFEGQVRILEEAQHRYGRWQNEECLSIKEGLLQYATPGTGRVPLNRFYTATLPGGWIPMETKEYLEEIGALDNSDPSNPRVVIPNYFDTPSNCINASAYYSVCCISECESLLGFLERRLGSPDAPPRRIVELVESLPSSSVEVPRKLSARLIERLESVAETHGGHAPLHGRLFRQWMHHAYPAECEFPGLSMTKKPRSPAEFMLETGHDVFIDEQTRLTYKYHSLGSTAQHEAAARAAPLDAPADGFADELPWSSEERLFIARRPAGVKTYSCYCACRNFILVAIAASMTRMLAQTVASAKSSIMQAASSKQVEHMV